MSERPVLYLIDGHAVAYRQYFALQRVPMSTQAGEPTAAVFGFTRQLLDILRDIRPEYLAVSFDEGLSARDEWYPDYKGTREKMPDDLSTQMVRIRQVVETLNIPVLTMDNSEADDVIGTIARQAEAQGVDVHIVTGDRDILQLLTPHVRVQLPSRKGPDKVYDVDVFIELYALHPTQLIDLKALMGDSSDNIPGVKGVGKKTATKLLQEYDTLDGIYGHIDDIKGSMQKKLIAEKDMAYLSQKLATIITDLNITLHLDACMTHDYDPMAVDALFSELDFNSLRQEFRALHEDVQFDPSPDMTTVIVDTEEKLADMVAVLDAAAAIVWDVETTSVDQMSADLVGIALAVDGKTGYYVPVGHKNPGSGTLFEEQVQQQLPMQTVLDAIRPALTNPNIAKIAHNASYDLVMLRRYGIDVSPIEFDTMIAEWMRDPISNNLSLKRFALSELGVTMTEISELIGTGKKQITMAEVAIEDAAPYAAADATVTYRAAKLLRPQLQELGVEKLYHDLEIPVIPVIADMEQAGALLDTPFLNEMSGILAEKIDALQTQICGYAENDAFNPSSPKQLNEVLFEKLKLPTDGIRKTSQGYSTNITTLEALMDAHAIVPLIVEYRELTKLKGTYVDALPQLINPKTGRVHTNYNQTGTSTGRFSSSNPNLQNIPIRTELGREVRRSFIAPEGMHLLAVDYSQIELRVMAHVSGDEGLKEAFREGQDIHRATAAAVNSIEPEDVTYEQRSFAKRVNFGLMYGMGAFRLARDSNLTLAEAEAFIRTYFERFPGVKRYMEDVERSAREKGYVETLLGRKRFFPQLGSGSSGQQAQSELRAAINMPIQGTAADILKLAMIKLHAALKEGDYPARMILQVHDELVLEVEEDALEETTKLVVETMQNAYPLDVPVVANASCGPNWLDMTDL
ncbi:DNA polymerase I [Phototrophicus methaneseepsis]|uniref:DNA polymerase I n=1 Tax=Phototrophicus methaneseepsis TaxID=2710758 RepID=A0A7S8E7G8_9CHLR|nr:DNA polymerase I [Phototrophicus methaneseepsis]QPC81755.1 DNA polymerase I [Phototrophicus methaneseepsis]